MQAVASSGGKDSTAMALLMAERGEDFVLLFTPAGNEPPELFAHVEQIACRIGKSLIQPPNETLAFWIDHHNALPNWRMRWCTRVDPQVSSTGTPSTRDEKTNPDLGKDPAP